MDEDFKIKGSPFVRKISDWEIEHVDVFHLKNLYKNLHEWLIENEYVSFDKHEDEKYETLYFQKKLDDGNSEHHIWWRAQKKPRDNDYLKYVILLDYQTLFISKRKISYKGQQISTNHGDIILRCKAYIMLDYKRDWRDHWFLRIIQRWFWKTLFRDQWLMHKETLWNESYSLQNRAKQFLELKSGSEQPELWFPDQKE